MRARKRGRMPVSTTPNYDRGTHNLFLRGLLTTILLPVLIFLAVTVFGLPGLKFESIYGPKDMRTETECIYLTFDGPQRVVPPVHQDRCPIIRLFPTKLIPTLF